MVRLFLRLLSTRQLRCGLLFVLLWAAMAEVDSVEAATLIVTSTADNGAGSLRAAIAMANDGDTIQFDATLNGQTITLTSAELAIEKNVTVSGPGPDLLAVEASGGFGIFHVMASHTAAIGGLAITGGNASGSVVRNDQATLTINNCTVTGGFDNTTSGGGGIYNNGESATLTILDTTVSGNWAFGGDGGGIYNNGGTLTVIHSIISGNMATGSFANGGGIFNSGMMNILNSAISDNHASIAGGGILNSGALTIIDSTISGNLAGTNFAGSGMGGGINSGGGSSATLVIRNSTISGNSAASAKGSTGVGGGIVNGTMLEISNSTVSGNFANQDAGGVANFGTLTIANSTLSDNQANRSGGGIYNDNSCKFEIENTIIKAGSSGANIFNNGGTVTSLGYNLSSDNGGGFLTATGDQINTDPLLGPLQDNGGSTFTHALLTGSLAIDAGDPNFTPPPLYDQRGPGYDRVLGGRIDIGSFEAEPSPTPSPTPTGTPIPTATPTVTPTPTPIPAQALNISTRLRVETGDDVMIGGFIITGGLSKNLALRGIGPSLSGLGINDALADPTLELRAANGMLLFQNDNWQDDPTQAAQLTSLGLAPQNPNESGLVATLQPGAYSVILAGKNDGTGVALVEIYDTNPAANSQLANISTRGFVQTGDKVMIGGFILGSGTASTAVAVRGIGPSLSQSGLTNVLADPTLELRDSNGMLLVANDNWQDDQVAAAQLSAQGLAPQDPLESGIVASLPPGAFTAILAGKNSATGLGLVEIYHVQ